VGASECDAAMSRKKPPIIVQDSEVRWNDDDFNLDSFGVGAPIEERLESLMRGGYTPEQVSVEIKDRYAKYLARMKAKDD